MNEYYKQQVDEWLESRKTEYCQSCFKRKKEKEMFSGSICIDCKGGEEDKQHAKKNA
ncbi:hypothetical protein LCGC14_0395580 [marine sediment metagenome]|uniref:Uncharacterized protein n=1 Tax=marine sediment metagenome TaxID=412755 RepID=A0A0F9TGG0_9ZZZZ